MFEKILIANRGEIAARIITTARRMGIATVAVHSETDSRARHVQMADEAVNIGPATVAESYLRGDRIIAAALATGAGAIHPGYGFLSENPDFADAVAAAGLTFIGPPASAIRAMGLKDAAKALMEKAGVPVVPGYHGDNRDPAFLAARATEIGYPVLIKARAGGGGKGMRRVDDPADFPAALGSAMREGEAAFGDPACLIEKYITRPRHIEMQVFADGHGNAVHLFERDCSLQRRHQKVIEEAPAPGMTEALRSAMGRAATDAAKAIGYSGAGTVEFIVDGSGPLREGGFWFMEMNTRLQVEHPVTEAVTGLDLVEWQLRVAAGESLGFAQGDLRLNGHAFEARLYAEDVPGGFLPATGRLDALRFPPASQFAPGALRIDSGVEEGDEIGPFYDPMIAKVITHAPTREAALARLQTALAETQVMGAVTNLDFLSALVAHQGFRAGEVDTGLIARDLDALLAESPLPPVFALAAALQAQGFLSVPETADPWDSLTGWRQWQPDSLAVTLLRGDDAIAVRLAAFPRGGFDAEINGQPLQGLLVSGGQTPVIEVAGHRQRLSLLRSGRQIAVSASGRRVVFALPEDRRSGDDPQGGDRILAPMPGLVSRLEAVAGQQVRKGQVLAVLEAMKMEHALTAPRDGTVAEVLAGQGDQVVKDALLLRLETEADNG